MPETDSGGTRTNNAKLSLRFLSSREASSRVKCSAPSPEQCSIQVDLNFYQLELSIRFFNCGQLVRFAPVRLDLSRASAC